jgi:hypothetical protein
MTQNYQTIYVELSSMSEATYRINLRTAINALQRGPIALAFPIIYLTRPNDPLIADITAVVKSTMNQMVDDLSSFGTLSKRPTQEGNYALIFFIPKEDNAPPTGGGGFGAPVPKVPYPTVGAGEIALPLPRKKHEEL